MGKPTLLVLNRTRAGTRLGAEVAEAAGQTAADLADAHLANRIVYAETLGQGLGAQEAARKGAAVAEVEALHREIMEMFE